MDFGLADNDAIGGNFGGIGELVAEFFVGEDDGDAVMFGAKLLGELEGIFGLCLGNGNEGIFVELGLVDV